MSWIAFLVLAAASVPDAGESSADIVNSGSTNTRGYVLHLSRSGPAIVGAQDGSAPRDAGVAPDLLNRFFESLDAAKPLDSLPAGNCPKSRSFGYSIHIRYDGANSPDLTCPVGSEEKELAALAAQIARAAQLSDQAPRQAPYP